MNRHRLSSQFTVFLMGLLILSACSSSTAVLPTEEEEGAVIEVTETDIADTELPIITNTPATEESSDEESEFQIITLLPKDAIRSIDEPEFYTVAEADKEYDPGEFVIGVEFDGQARAYSVPYLSSREIVNDIINGKPISVTW